MEAILTLGKSEVLQLGAGQGERRKRPRSEGPSRICGRAIEFAGVAMIAVCLAGAGLTMVEAAFARPLEMVSNALAP